MGLEWHGNRKDEWCAEHAAKVSHCLQADVFPLLGTRPIDRIDASELLEVLRRIEQRGALDLAGRARHICGQVFRYGIQTGRCREDVALHLWGALKTRQTRHFAAFEAREIPEFLTALERDDVRLHDRTRRAIKLSLLTFLRPGELRQGTWSEIDWEAKQWIIPAERMKMRRAHIVPLLRQALEVLKAQQDEVKCLSTPWIFPSQIRPREPMSDSTVLVALKALASGAG